MVCWIQPASTTHEFFSSPPNSFEMNVFIIIIRTILTTKIFNNVYTVLSKGYYNCTGIFYFLVEKDKR